MTAPPLIPAWRRHALPLAGLLFLAFAANLPALSGLFDTDPALSFSGLAQGVRPGWLAEPPGWVDPAVGMYTQPLGQLAMRDWLHGQVPWWNPYSGLGMQLAAETNGPAFFFPFNLVMFSGQGWLWLRALMQALCGMLAYWLCAELGLARLAAFLGGGLYALSPEFLLGPHSAIDPMPFLPLLLIGIERAGRGRRGWTLIAAALAWSITAGFPETALFDGLLAGVWALVRAPRRALAGFAGQLGLGILLGTAVTAPLLLPFLDYTAQADLGAHGSPLLARAVVSPGTFGLQILPFAFGLFGATPPPAAAAGFAWGWVRLPGWIDLQVLLFALAALWRRGQALRWALAGWVLFWELRDAGAAPLMALVNALPVINATDYTRFSGPSLNFALYLLAAFGFDDFLRAPPLGRRRLAGLGLSLAALGLLLLTPGWRYFHAWYAADPPALARGGLAMAFGLAVLAFAMRELACRRHPRLLAGLLLAGMLAELAGAQLGGARAGKLDLAPVRYLQAHTGLARMVSLGPLNSNFNLPYGIASLTYSSMPAPKLMATEVFHHLVTFNPIDFNINDPSLFTNFNYVLPRLAQDGVGYVVAPAGVDWQRLEDVSQTPPNPQPQALPPGGAKFNFFLGLAAPRHIAGLRLRLAGAGAAPLALSLCVWSACAQATAVMPAGGGAVSFVFAQPIDIDIGYQPARIRLTPLGGPPVTYFAAIDDHDDEEPAMTILAQRQPRTAQQVFTDGRVAIWRLAGTAPYAALDNPACTLRVFTRTRMLADCPAPARLTRLEMFDPGWRTWVNGKPQTVSMAQGRFQSVALPAGQSLVTFRYAPSHARLAWGLAGLAALLWGGLAAGRKKPLF